MVGLSAPRFTSKFVALDDNPYFNNAKSSWGYTLSGVDKDSTAQDFTDHHLQQAANPGWQSLRAGVQELYYVPGDHGWGGDNWDHTQTQAAAQGGIGASTYQHVYDHWKTGKLVHDSYASSYYDNPSDYTHPSRVAEYPSEVISQSPTGQSLDHFQPMYFAKYYDINGSELPTSSGAHVVMLVLDCISHRSPLTATDDASKTMLGVNQLAWVKAVLLEAESEGVPLKAILAAKTLFLVTGNGDIWRKYTTERDDLLSYIHSNITGVIYCCGDQHHSHVSKADTSDGDAYDMLCVCAAPAGVEQNNISAVGADQNIWVDRNAVLDDGGNELVWGLLEAHTDRWVVKVMPIDGGAPKWQGQVLAGQNKLSYADIAAAV